MLVRCVSPLSNVYIGGLRAIYTSVSYIQVGLLALLAPLLEMGFEREACRRRANPDPNPNPNPNLNPNPSPNPNPKP